MSLEMKTVAISQLGHTLTEREREVHVLMHTPCVRVFIVWDCIYFSIL